MGGNIHDNFPLPVAASNSVDNDDLNDDDILVDTQDNVAAAANSNSNSPSPADNDADMAAAVASMPHQFPPPPFPSSSPNLNAPAPSGVNKRYRPVPAKTFQCRGYGDCRMVFSRSEHLARHIRKHTGERPFTCHCAKQFSRLDNLRQHAQTVHADKQEQNERMMHELTSLHASMTAATKGGGTRGKRAQQSTVVSAGGMGGGNLDGTLPSMSVKQEDAQMGMPTIHQRPGTSTGYEGDNSMIYHHGSNWHVQTTDVDRRNANNHSFRDPSQSFRAPTSSSPSSTGPAAASSAFAQQQFLQQQQQHPGQSFLVPSSATFNFSLPDIANHASSGSQSGPGSGPRPASSSAAADPNRSLPSISTVVSASLAGALSLPHQPPPPAFVVPHQPALGGQHTHTSLTDSHILPLPTPSAQYGIHGRRPSTATRPGTAPASYYYPAATNAFAPGSGSVPAMVSHGRPELSLSFLSGQQQLHGRWANGNGSSSSQLYRSYSGSNGGGDSAASGGDEPTSPAGGTYDSPFSFHAPSTNTSSVSEQYGYRDQQQQHYGGAAGVPNPRKRPHSGSDDDDVAARERGRPDAAGRPISSSGRGAPPRPGTSGGLEYDYGSESRPQSRRLSVMELCNDTDADPAAARPFIPISAAATAAVSRPTTSSGLVTSASQLQLSDRPTPPPQQQPSCTPSPFGPGHGHLAHQQQFQQQQRTPSPQQYRTSPSLLARAASAAAGANAASAGTDVSGAATPRGAFAAATASPRGGARTTEFGGGVSPAASVGRGFSSTTATSTYYQQQSPRSSGSQSPVFPSAASGAAGVGGNVYGRGASGRVSSIGGDVGSPGSVSSSGSGGSPGGESQRGNDRVRFSAPVGMRA